MVGLPEYQVESGWICQRTDSCVWGLLGVFVIKIGNGLCMSLYSLLPGLISRILILVLMGFLAVDAIATLTILFGHSKNPERWIAADRDIDSATKKLGAKIDDVVNRRITKAYPQKQHTESEEAHPEIFAYGCSFYKIVLLFFIGAFLGDITETIFCRITAGYWMSAAVWYGEISVLCGDLPLQRLQPFSINTETAPSSSFSGWVHFLVVPMNISAVFSQKSCLEPYSGITAISRLTLVEESIFCTVFSGDLLQWHGLKYSIRLFPG